MSSLLQGRLFTPPPVKVNSEHNEQINLVMDLMGESIKDRKRYAYWCGRLKRFKPSAIHLLLQQAKTGKNPRALFNYLIKKK